MEKFIDLSKELIEKQNQKDDREFGKYYVSELWGIVNGYKTIDDVLNGEKLDLTSSYKTIKGTIWHEVIQSLLDAKCYEIEKRIEIPVNDEIKLVGKIDIYDKLNNEVWELKTSDEVMEKPKSWHKYQVKMYLSMVEAEKGYIFQPVIKMNGKKIEKFGLFLLGEVKRDNKFYAKQIEFLKQFHQKVKDYKLNKNCERKDNKQPI